MLKRVLIVEDDEDLRRLYKTALRFAGFAVEEASDGLHALNAIDANPPDLVVLDLMLPRIDGFVVQQDIAARAHTKHIPVVVVTGTSQNISQLDVPCTLRKPVTSERLVDAVRRCLIQPPERLS